MIAQDDDMTDSKNAWRNSTLKHEVGLDVIAEAIAGLGINQI
jgi:hypothetical protein